MLTICRWCGAYRLKEENTYDHESETVAQVLYPCSPSLVHKDWQRPVYSLHIRNITIRALPTRYIGSKYEFSHI